MRRAGLIAALAVRLAVALAIRTAFAPDEFWQSIEVAHRLVFGYGHLTWEWAAGLRSYAHPLLFAAPYAALKALRLDTPWAVARVPLLLQALVAVATDMHVSWLAVLVLGQQAARWCLVCQLASWFNAYCLGRTYSNSLEAALTAAGTYHWLLARQLTHTGGRGGKHGRSSADAGSSRGSSAQPGRGRRAVVGRKADAAEAEVAAAAARRRRSQRVWLICAALSVVFRPASALFWVLPAALALAQQQHGRARWQLLGDAAALGGGLLGGAAVLDRIFYGRWVAVPWEFFKFNLLAGASAQYGGHPWHWNITQGLPTVAASLLPLLAAGLAMAPPDARLPALLAAWSLAAYSLPAHKEFRFLLPALQLIMPYCGLAAARVLGGDLSRGSRGSRGQAEAQAKARQSAAREGGASGDAGGRGGSYGRWPGSPRRWWRWGGAACLLLQLPMAAYFLLAHQGAQVNIMHIIRREAAAAAAAELTWPAAGAADTGGSANASTSVLFLTPCHSTPYYTHVHAPIPMRFLDCSPPQHAAATAALNWREQAWLELPADCPAAQQAGSDSSGESSGQEGSDSSGESSGQAGGRLSQRQCFERDPGAYLAALLGAPGGPPSPTSPPAQQRPRLLVGYAPLMGSQALELQRWGYRLHSRLRNCWVQTDGDSPCELQLWAC